MTTTTVKCPDCNQVFKRESYLKQHQGRKIKCAVVAVVVGDNNCAQCGKNFCNKSSLTRHGTRCKAIKADPIQVADIGEIAKLNNKIKELEEELKKKIDIDIKLLKLEEESIKKTDIDAKFLQLEKLINDKNSALVSVPVAAPVIYCGDDNSTTVNIANIIINNFTTPNSDDIGSDLKILKCMANPNNPEYNQKILIESIYYNRNRPENHSVFLSHDGSSLVVRHNDEWTLYQDDETKLTIVKSMYNSVKNIYRPFYTHSTSGLALCSMNGIEYMIKEHVWVSVEFMNKIASDRNNAHVKINACRDPEAKKVFDYVAKPGQIGVSDARNQKYL